MIMPAVFFHADEVQPNVCVLSCIVEHFAKSSNSSIVSWLPKFHAGPELLQIM